MIKSNSFHNSY